MRRLVHALIPAVLPGLAAACDPASNRAVPTASASASSSAPAAPATAEPPRRQLRARGTLDAGAMAEARAKVLGALRKAKALGGQKKNRDALAELDGVLGLDPVGVVLGLEASRYALADGDKSLAARWLRRAAMSSAGHDALASKLAEVRAKLEPAVAPSSSGPFKSIDEACAAVTALLRDKKVEAPSGEAGEAKCAADFSLELVGKDIERATVMLVESKSSRGTDILAWVALKTAAGVLAYGPVESTFAPRAYGLTNEFVVDLQKVDVLPGGSPEVVVRVDARKTAVDVALGEKVEIDDARVLLLTTDRGKLESSRPLMLSELRLRDRIDPKDARLPAGYAHAKLLGTGAEYQMKVSWGAPNTITLTRFLGNLGPPDQGTITLFP